MEGFHDRDVAEYDPLYPLSGLSGLVRIMDAVREEERQELARALHDTVIQPLASLTVSLTLFERQPDAVRSVAPFVEAWHQQAQEALDSLRSTLVRLSWQLPANSGLAETLRSRLGPQLQRQGITLTIEERAWPNDVPSDWTGQLYLTVREALTNVAKHAHASEARVTLDCDPRCLTVVVQDDGDGFPRDDWVSPSPQPAGSGLGIACMHARVQALDGHLAIVAASGAGTRIEILLPNPTSRRRRAASALDRALQAGGSCP